jgi:formylglycine-generating enzyme required for sulfatase activity
MIASRGGSWLDPPEHVRNARRGRDTSDCTIYNLGALCAW